MVDKPTSPNRVIVIGLDCATFDLIKPWAQQGHLPNLARLMAQGSHGVLRSTIPTISPAAWTSFMTGKNPGKHGIFDFFQRKSDSYDTFIVRNNLPAQGTLFRHLSEAGYRVGVANVPMTYPPEPVNGFMISGLGAPDNFAYTYPPELVNRLKEQQYTINNPPFSAETAGEFFDVLVHNTNLRANAILELLRQEAWDFFMVVFRDIDTILAFYWHYMDPTHPLHNPDEGAKYGHAILEYHKQVDTIIGQMLEAFGEGITLVMSDHGGGPLHKEVHLNRWLAQEGFLGFRERKDFKSALLASLRSVGITRDSITKAIGWPAVDWLKSRLPLTARTWIPWESPNLVEMIDWSKTQAYSFGHIGQIFINLRGREPQGIVSPGEEYHQVVSKIVERLKQLQDPETGEFVVTAIYLRDEIYSGVFTDRSPDINVVFCDMRYLTHIGTEFSHEAIFGPPVHNETGTHRLDGMLIVHGDPIRQGLELGQPANIIDLAPTIYYLMGVSIPEDTDGRILNAVLKSDFLATHQVTHTESISQEEKLEAWSGEDEGEVVQRLRDLGYLN